MSCGTGSEFTKQVTQRAVEALRSPAANSSAVAASVYGFDCRELDGCAVSEQPDRCIKRRLTDQRWLGFAIGQ
jgi:hypothetical protein